MSVGKLDYNFEYDKKYRVRVKSFKQFGKRRPFSWNDEGYMDYLYGRVVEGTFDGLSLVVENTNWLADCTFGTWSLNVNDLDPNYGVVELSPTKETKQEHALEDQKTYVIRIKTKKQFGSSTPDNWVDKMDYLYGQVVVAKYIKCYNKFKLESGGWTIEMSNIDLEYGFSEYDPSTKIESQETIEYKEEFKALDNLVEVKKTETKKIVTVDKKMYKAVKVKNITDIKEGDLVIVKDKKKYVSGYGESGVVEFVEQMLPTKGKVYKVICVDSDNAIKLDTKCDTGEFWYYHRKWVKKLVEVTPKKEK